MGKDKKLRQREDQIRSGSMGKYGGTVVGTASRCEVTVLIPESKKVADGHGCPTVGPR